jgi:hypothetical protein
LLSAAALTATRNDFQNHRFSTPVRFSI